MGCLPYFKFYAADWLSGVLGLTLEEQGAYIRLLAWSWEKGPLPLEDSKRATILGVSQPKLASLWNELSEHWEETEVGFVNERLETERAKLADQHDALSKAGSEGAKKRWAAYRLAKGLGNGQAIDPATGEVIEVANG